jgi:hypothetical protein
MEDEITFTDSTSGRTVGYILKIRRIDPRSAKSEDESVLPERRANPSYPRNPFPLCWFLQLFTSGLT